MRAAMFNLSRFFSTLSLLLILVAAGVLGLLYRELSLRQMGEQAESRNVEMARVFDNLWHEEIESWVLNSPGRDGATLQQAPEFAELHGKAVALLRNTGVLQLRICNRLGAVVFSTDAAHVGENAPRGAGFRTAMGGSVFSEFLPHRRGGTQVAQDVVASHIPLRSADQTVIGSLELDQDVSPFMIQLQRHLWLVMGGVLAVCATLYFLQFLVVRRAQQILTEQERRLKAAHDALEVQVDARTDRLRQANRRLESEIDIRRKAEDKLNYLAFHDSLTGLANRQRFIECLEEAMSRAGRSGLRLAVLLVDLDQFKQINDSLGHAVGDELLQAVSTRLADTVQLIDVLARLGGDEFICLMEGVRNEADVATLASDIRNVFTAPFVFDEHEFFLSASIGICLFPGDGDSALELVRNADTAMYRAKSIGRGQFHFYTPEMTRDARERIRLENLLHGALNNGELSVHFQPQIDAASGSLIGAEALARWDNPRLGSISPLRFIPIAEEAGIIVELGSWVLRETCRQVVEWEREGFRLPRVSVNISVRQLERPEFVDSLRGILEETGMEPGRLKLEITESVVMAMGDACELLKQLSALGVTLAIDDFGTGYSSLSYLKLLPVHQLKIDRSFIVGIGSNSGDEAIIETVMALARSLGFEVLAEGVETSGQAEFLGGLGCHQFQGYLYGKALPSSEFVDFWQFHP